MTLVDNHNHILLAEITEILAAAKANNVSELSITEHVSQFREPRESIRFGSIHPSGRIFQSLKDYNDEFRKADRLAYSGMKINRGLEVDFSPRFETKLGDFVNQEEWDILLCSVHEFEDGKDIERTVRGKADPAFAHEHWRRYLPPRPSGAGSAFVPLKTVSRPASMSIAPTGRSTRPPYRLP